MLTGVISFIYLSYENITIYKTQVKAQTAVKNLIKLQSISSKAVIQA